MFLLDTLVLLWAASGSPRLSEHTRKLLEDPSVQKTFSVASMWEVVIKASMGRADFSVNPGRLRTAGLRAGLNELPVRSPHVIEVGTLPELHRDPFDRLLLAQARVEGLQLLTVDRAVLAYGSPALSA